MITFTNFVSKLICGAIIISGQMLTVAGTEMALSDKTKSSHYGMSSINIPTKGDTRKLFSSTSSGKSSPISISSIPTCTDQDKAAIDKMYGDLLAQKYSPMIIYQKLRKKFGDNEGNVDYIDKLDFKSDSSNGNIMPDSKVSQQ